MAFTLEQFLSINTEVSATSKAAESIKSAAVKTKEVAVKTGGTLLDMAPAHRGLVKAVAEESLLRDRELVYELRKNREAINRIAGLLGVEGVQESTADEIKAALEIMAEKALAAEKAEKEAKKAAAVEKRQSVINVLGLKKGEAAQEVPQVKVIEVPQQEPVEESLSGRLKGLLFGSESAPVVEPSNEPAKAEKPQEEAPEASAAAPTVQLPGQKKNYFSTPNQARYNYSQSGDMA